MKIRVQQFLIASSLAVLSACGGGGGGDSQSPSDNVGSITSMKFSVALSAVDVRRVSDGDELVVDTASINSEQLTLIK